MALSANVAQPIIRDVKRMARRTIRDVKKIRKNRVLTAERIASMKLQGEYLGLLVKLPQSQRAKFQAIAKTAGREKAIAAMKKAQRT